MELPPYHLLSVLALSGAEVINLFKIGSKSNGSRARRNWEKRLGDERRRGVRDGAAFLTNCHQYQCSSLGLLLSSS